MAPEEVLPEGEVAPEGQDYTYEVPLEPYEVGAEEVLPDSWFPSSKDVFFPPWAPPSEDEENHETDSDDGDADEALGQQNVEREALPDIRKVVFRPAGLQPG